MCSCSERLREEATPLYSWLHLLVGKDPLSSSHLKPLRVSCTISDRKTNIKTRSIDCCRPQQVSARPEMSTICYHGFMLLFQFRVWEETQAAPLDHTWKRGFFCYFNVFVVNNNKNNNKNVIWRLKPEWFIASQWLAKTRIRDELARSGRRNVGGFGVYSVRPEL
jgi:hypothetical protein